MNKESNKRGFYQSAMYYGTILGCIWCSMYFLMFIGIGSLLMLTGCLALFIGSPFFAASFAKKYRRNECFDRMKYLQAVAFIYCMYICASLLSALAMYIYLMFIDNGMFFATIQEILKASMQLPGADNIYKQQTELALQMIQETTTSEFVWQIFGNNIFNASILPFIIAFFVSKNNNE